MANRKVKNPNAPVTNQTLGEAVDAILKGMESLPTRDEVNSRFDQVDTRLTNIEAEVMFIKRTIGKAKSEFTSKSEFNQLKQIVEKLERRLVLS